MQAILQNPDLANTLFETILESPNGRKSLSRLARTCKALKEPALNMLWRDLDSLVPLLTLFPSHLFKRARRPGQGFVKMPEDSDWKRILAYGERVRRITYNESAGNINPNIFSVLEDYRPQDFILPNLTTLVWRAETPEGLQRSALFICSELQSVVIETGNRILTQDLDAFFTEVAAECDISSLSITSMAKLPNNLTRLFPAVGPLENIGLMAPGATSPVIGHWLLSMPMLRSLQLDVVGRSDDDLVAFFAENGRRGRSPSLDIRTPDSGVFSGEESESASEVLEKAKLRMTLLNESATRRGFKQLRHLKLMGNATSVTSFLDHVYTPLRNLELVIDSPEGSAVWQTLCTTVQQQFWGTLQSFQVSGSVYSRFSDLVRSTPRAEPSSWRLIMEGFQFLPHLRWLEIDLPESLILLPSDIQQLAAACPKLEILKICPLSRWPVSSGPPPLTLGDLLPLMEGCRNLHTLFIPINASDVFDEENTTPDSSSLSLLRMHVGHSWVGDPLQATIVLSHLAPYLESLRWFHEKNRPGYVENNSLGWQKVSEMLPQLQRLRHFERQHVRVEKVQPILPQIPARSFADKVVDAVVSRTMVDHAVLVRPSVKQRAVHARPQVTHKSVGVEMEMFSRAIDATPQVSQQGVETVPEIVEETKSQPPSPVESGVTEKNTGDLIEMASLNEKRSMRSSNGENRGSNGMFRSIIQTVRNMSPPILLRLLDMLALTSASSRSSRSSSTRT